ncbi:MAG: hypothetical protein OHK0039_45370 [Bacteroidia bacterium]
MTDHLYSGDGYDCIKKIYSINILYFDLGQGSDYVYVGRTEFRGLHTQDVLQLSTRQRAIYPVQQVSDLFTTYYLLKVNQFDDVARNSLDEWIYFLKHSEIKEEFHAKGLPEARERLRIDRLDDAEREHYEAYLKLQRIRNNELQTARQEGYSQARETYAPLVEAERQAKEAALRALRATVRHLADTMSAAQIAALLQLPEDEVAALLR